jgi:hypothetical protein
MSKMSEAELIELVQRISGASACMMDFDALVSKLEQNVPHPNASELIFNPPGGTVLSAEEVVRIALSWQPGSSLAIDDDEI